MTHSTVTVHADDRTWPPTTSRAERRPLGAVAVLIALLVLFAPGPMGTAFAAPSTAEAQTAEAGVSEEAVTDRRDAPARARRLGPRRRRVDRRRAPTTRRCCHQVPGPAALTRCTPRRGPPHLAG